MGSDGGEGVLGDAQLIMMGSGEHKDAEFIRSTERRFKGRVCGYVGFSAMALFSPLPPPLHAAPKCVLRGSAPCVSYIPSHSIP